jgi:DNA-binding MarR family transcriptional regulator
MASGLAAMGYDDYRRSDAAVIRLLQRGPVPIGRLGEATGVSRQAARKMVDSLQGRGFATTSRDGSDSRQINVLLTDRGVSYARAVVAVIERLNRELCARVDPDDLASADTVLRAVVTDPHGRQRAEQLAPPSAHAPR